MLGFGVLPQSIMLYVELKHVIVFLFDSLDLVLLRYSFTFVNRSSHDGETHVRSVPQRFDDQSFSANDDEGYASFTRFPLHEFSQLLPVILIRWPFLSS